HDALSGKLLIRVPVNDTGISALAFSPDSRRLACVGHDSLIHVFGVLYGREEAAYRGHTGLVESVAFSGDGRRIVSGGVDGSARVWDAEAVQGMEYQGFHKGYRFNAATLAATNRTVVVTRFTSSTKDQISDVAVCDLPGREAVFTIPLGDVRGH